MGIGLFLLWAESLFWAGYFASMAFTGIPAEKYRVLISFTALEREIFHSPLEPVLVDAVFFQAILQRFIGDPERLGGLFQSSVAVAQGFGEHFLLPIGQGADFCTLHSSETGYRRGDGQIIRTKDG